MHGMSFSAQTAGRPNLGVGSKIAKVAPKIEIGRWKSEPVSESVGCVGGLGGGLGRGVGWFGLVCRARNQAAGRNR